MKIVICYLHNRSINLGIIKSLYRQTDRHTDRQTDRQECELPLAVVIAAHAKLLGARLHAAAHHQPVARLEDVQRAAHAGVGHRAHEDGDVLGEAGAHERDGEEDGDEGGGGEQSYKQEALL